MEGELGSGARIAIALIVIGVIISVIFVILGFTRGTTNQGITSVQNSMDSMSLAQFDDYDQKILSGTQVVSAVKLFEGRPVAMVTRSKEMMTTGDNHFEMGYNYGALLTSVTSGGNFLTPAMVKGTGTNSSVFISSIASSGSPTYNMVYIPMSQSGTEQFVRPTAKFLAEIIKDSTGTIIGVCFTQQ